MAGESTKGTRVIALVGPAGAGKTSLAEAMLRLLRDRELAARLGVAGRRHVYPRYDSSRLVDDVKSLYLRELAGRGRTLPSIGVPA